MRPTHALAALALLALAGCHPAAASPRAVPAPAEVAAGVRLTRIATGLAKPVALAFAPGDAGGRLFVAEQTGTIRVVRDGVVDSEPFLDLTARVSPSAGARHSEQGLLGLAFHPRFAENGCLFVNLTDPTGATRVLGFAARRGDPDRADPASEREVLRVDQPYANHNGGHLAFGPDGVLYVGLGDGGSAGDPRGNGQNADALLGKLLALDVDGPPNAHPRTIALGLRNPWRYAFDRATGDLWIGDVGQHAFEEIDVLSPAMRAAAVPTNFGWNVVEGLHCFRAPTCDQRGFTPPVAEYGHDDGCSITGGYVYRGRRLPALVGRYFYADYCTAMIRSLTWDGRTVREVWDWRAALDPERRLANLSSFGEDAAGELYLASIDGDVYRFDPR
ncbi:MAG: PQQ-dependent sugar dehydrogenase [Deltaproteobacteria bacterium]|nr:PQQ-dependent sugar dehydrogenase [Deltaproteobacteria bacterium]